MKIADLLKYEDFAGHIERTLSWYLSQLTGQAWFDGAAALVIGLILAATAAWLALETKSLLIGESATPEVIAGIERIVLSRPRVLQLNEVLTMHMGPDFVLVNLSVEFRDEESTESIEHSIASIDEEIKRTFPEVQRVFVEAETHAAPER